MAYRKAGFCMVCVVGVACAGAAGEVVELAPSQDGTLYESGTGDLANGAGQHLFLGQTSRGDIRRALLAFDVLSIPAGSTINSVSLKMWMSRTASGSVSPVSMHRVTSDWGTGASDAGAPGGTGTQAAPGDATWIHTFYDTETWTTPGGDFEAGASATTGVSLTDFYTWSSAGMASDVQAWVDGALGNFGWILIGNESDLGTAKRFGSSESSDPLARPVLTIDYTAVPAPGVVALLAGGGLFGLRRRR